MSVGSGTVTVSYTGPYAFADGSTGYWGVSPSTYTSPNISNPPPANGLIALAEPGTHTLTFSEPVGRVAIAILSLGQLTLPVTYTFDQPVTLENFGPGYWGNGTLTQVSSVAIEGREGHGVIRLNGFGITSVSWTNAPAEYWHGFTVGVTPVPEPGTLAALGLGAVALVRRRRKSTSK